MANESRVRQAGVACAVGGALWTIALLPAVPFHDAIYGSTTAYRAWEGLLVVVDVLLLVGVAGLAGSGAAGAGALGRIGLGIALLGRTSFLVGEILSFARGRDDAMFVPLGALVTAVGMTVAGIAVVRARRWDGWNRVLPLLTGVYPFVAMFPVLAITHHKSDLIIALWGIVWLLLGIALQARRSPAGAAQRAAKAAAYS
ncbi:MAG TPA: hypothetical protein VFL91_14440 [Thermomicrobiales bacterium]|nr:hypothetical protein [Thermomicrobiales bacterium]